MESKVAVVHRSEIVRKGLASILNPFWKGDILQILDIHSFFKRGFCQTCRMLVFTEAEQMDQITEPSENSIFVALFDTEKQIEPHFSKSMAVSLRSDFSLFQNIIEDFRRESTPYATDENELTLREKEILRQVAMGFSNKEIADSLFISIHTVITHRKNITGKLGIKSISGLTVYAIINRLIDPDMTDPEKLI
jgi:DNA-binding CsgD family transcriptional regulator